jgi:hypothetical protein
LENFLSSGIRKGFSVNKKQNEKGE